MRRIAHRVVHLVKRFWWAITARRVSSDDRVWVVSTLLPVELALFDRMSRADQEHHLRVTYALADLHERAGDVPRARQLFAIVAAADPELGDVAARLRALR